MSRSGSASADRPALPVLLVVLSLFATLGILPPETHGESLAGCALLIVLFAALPGLRPSPAGRAAVGIAAVAALLLARSAVAPGPAVEPLASWILALSLAVAAWESGPVLRSDPGVPWTLALLGGVTGGRAVYEKLWGLAHLARQVEASPELPDHALVLARLREGRAYGAFATPAALGGFLAMAAAVTCGFAVSRRGRARIVLLALAAIEVAGIAATASATAAGALAVAAGLALLGSRARRRGAIAAVSITVLLLGAVVALRGSRLLTLADAESPWRQRAGNFRIALEVASDHPWLGVGPGGFGEIFPSYRREGDNESRHVHDLPLEAAAELGVPLGILLTGVFLFVFLRPVLARAAPGEEGWHRGAAVALAAFAVQSFFDFTSFLPSLLWTACLLRGALRASDEAPEPVAEQERGMRFAALAATSLAAGIAVLSGLAANAKLDARNLVAEGDTLRSSERAERAVHLAPWDVDARMFRAEQTFELAGDLRSEPSLIARATSDVDRAVLLSPVRPSARELRSRIRLTTGDLPGGYADLVEAARLYPLRTEYAQRRDAVGQHLRVLLSGEREPR